MRGKTLAVVLCVLAWAAVPARAAGLDKYSIVHGCFALQSASTGKFAVRQPDGSVRADAASPGAAEAFRMQASALAHYLFYAKPGDFLAAPNGTVGIASSPNADANWHVDDAPGGFTIDLPSQQKSLALASNNTLVLASKAATFRLVPTAGCATFPEAEVDVTGTPFTGAAPWAQQRGFIDAHFHWMAFEFLGGDAHCGRPWSPYGIVTALTDCPDHYPNGSGAVLENFLSSGTPYGTHDVHGWPSFIGWPRHDSLTHEGSYYVWVERAWRAGLRMATVLLVDNAVLCEAYPLKRNSCDEMATIRLEAKDMYELQDYIDAQEGGPGKGWLRIVRSPEEARAVVNAGKLAIVLGIESSRLFECQDNNGTPGCDVAQIDKGLDEVYGFGVRQMEIVNKFDNALTGVAGDSGNTGLVVNNGNKIETGHYWRMQTCQNLPQDVHDQTQPTAPGMLESDPVLSGVIANYLPTGQTPIYPPGPHCNEAGLTDLGAHLIRKMIAKHMIFDPDHMSVKARMQALDILEQAKYPGVVSSHSWSTPDAYPRIYKLGGFITPITGDSPGFVQEWKLLKPESAPKYYWGFGYGSDMNGFHAEPPPRDLKAKNAAPPVTYPYKTFDGGSTVYKEKTGTRTWDVNVDGVAQYGQLPDWIEDLRKVGGDQIVTDMGRGTEAYLEMWERADGIPGGTCAPAKALVTSRGVAGVELGADPTTTLYAAGQPRTRGAAVWRWCVDGSGTAQVADVLDATGHVVLAGTNSRGARAGRIRPGSRASAARRHATRAGAHLYLRRARNGSRVVFAVRRGRVRWVGVASKRLAHSRKALRRAAQQLAL